MMAARIFQGCAILALWIIRTAVSVSTPEQTLIDEKNPPKYEYGYVVSDQQGSSQGHVESRHGAYALGRYYVNLPNGSEQKVTYFADNWGYHPLVSYTSTTASGTSRIEFAMGDKATAALKESSPTVVSTMNVSPNLAAGVQILSHGSSGHSLPPNLVSSTTPQPVEVSTVSGTPSPSVVSFSPSVSSTFQSYASPSPSPTSVTPSDAPTTAGSGIQSSTEITNELGSASPTVQQYVPSTLDSVPLGLAPFLLHGVSPSYHITPPPPVQVKKENVHIVTPSSVDNPDAYFPAIDHNSIVANDSEGGTAQFTHNGQNIKITSYLADTNKVLFYGDRIGVPEQDDSQEQKLINEIQEHAKQRIIKDLQEKESREVTTFKPIVVSDQINYLAVSTTQAPVHVVSPSNNDVLSQSIISYNSGQSGYNDVGASYSTESSSAPTAEPLVDSSNSVSEKSEVTKIYRSTDNQILITPRPNEIEEQLAQLRAGISILSAPEAGYSSQTSAPETGYSFQTSAPQAVYSPQTSAPETGYSFQTSAPEARYSSQTFAPEARYSSPTSAPVVEENKDEEQYKTIVDIQEGIALQIQENPDGSIQLRPDVAQNEVAQQPTQYQGLGYERRLVNPEAQQVVQEADPVLRDQKQTDLLIKQQNELEQTQQNLQELQQKIINEIDAQHEEEQRKYETIHEERNEHLENLQKVDSLTKESSNQVSEAINVTPNYESVSSYQTPESVSSYQTQGSISSYQTPEQMIIVTPEPNTNQVEIEITNKEEVHPTYQNNPSYEDNPNYQYNPSYQHNPTYQEHPTYQNPTYQDNPYLVTQIHPTAETYIPQGDNHNHNQIIIEEDKVVQDLSPPPAPPAVVSIEVEKPVLIPKPTVIETTKVVEIEKPIVVKEPVPIQQTRIVEVEKPVTVVQPYPVEITKVVHVDRPVAVPAPYAVTQPVPYPFAIPHAVGVPIHHLIPYPEIFPILHKEYHPIYIHRPYNMKPSIRVPEPMFKEAARDVYAQSHYYHTIPLHMKLAPTKHKGHYSHLDFSKSHYHKIHQQPHSGRNKNVLKNLRIEYGFKPPLKPSLEIKEEPKPSIYGPSVRPDSY